MPDARPPAAQAAHWTIPAGSLDRASIDSEEAAKLRSLGYLTGLRGGSGKSYGPADDPKNLIEVDRDLHRVVELFQLQRSAEAIPIAKKLVAEHPDMQTGYLQLGYLLQQHGDPDGALRVYEQADRARASAARMSTASGVCFSPRTAAPQRR